MIILRFPLFSSSFIIIIIITFSFIKLKVRIHCILFLSFDFRRVIRFFPVAPSLLKTAARVRIFVMVFLFNLTNPLDTAAAAAVCVFCLCLINTREKYWK